MMIKIVSFKICPFVQRVTAMLETKNIPYEIEYISLNDKPQWFLDISPNGQVPILITDSGTALFESDAIVEYLDEISDPLESDISPEQRAIDRAWSYLATKNYLVQCYAQCGSKHIGRTFCQAKKSLSKGRKYFGNNDLLKRRKNQQCRYSMVTLAASSQYY